MKEYKNSWKKVCAYKSLKDKSTMHQILIYAERNTLTTN